MTRAEEEYLAKMIREAVSASQTYINEPDGGTCNFDHAYLCVPRMRQSAAERIAKLSGQRLTLETYSYHGRILEISSGLSGQGARRTKMAEAVCDHLKQNGFDASVWYQMD